MKSGVQSNQSMDISELPVLILAGGLGTRLRSAFDSGPKSMAPVGGRPFLEYLLLQVRDAGFRNILLCVGYGREQIESWAGDGARWGLGIRYSSEPEPRGTAGAVKLAEGLIDSEVFLVMNGDSYLAADLRRMVEFHLRSDAWATIALVEVRDASRYGTVVLSAEGKIAAFLEKRVGAGGSGSQNLINGGVYVFRNSVLSVVPELKAVSLEREILPQLLTKKVNGFISEGYFIDIGLPHDFMRAQIELPEHI